MLENNDTNEYTMKAAKIVILPGNGGGDVRRSNWYGWLERKLLSMSIDGLKIELRNMPDPHVARESVWLPFVREEIGVDEATIVIGESLFSFLFASR